MEPTDARRVFPGFDEPRFKTPFTVTVVAPRGNVVVANGPLEKEEAAPDGLVRHRFARTLPLPTYLVALAVGPLDVVKAPDLPPNEVRRVPLPLRGVATRGQGPKLAFALQHTPDLVRRLETYFGLAYPYQKLDIISSPGMPGAMENAGAVLFNDSYLLLGEDAPPAQQRDFGHVGAHEYRASLVRQPRHSTLVGRHLVERGIRRVDGAQDQRRMAAGPGDLVGPYGGGARGDDC